MFKCSFSQNNLTSGSHWGLFDLVQSGELWLPSGRFQLQFGVFSLWRECGPSGLVMSDSLQLQGGALQAPLSMGFPRQVYWNGLLLHCEGKLHYKVFWREATGLMGLGIHVNVTFWLTRFWFILVTLVIHRQWVLIASSKISSMFSLFLSPWTLCKQVSGCGRDWGTLARVTLWCVPKAHSLLFLSSCYKSRWELSFPLPPLSWDPGQWDYKADSSVCLPYLSRCLCLFPPWSRLICRSLGVASGPSWEAFSFRIEEEAVRLSSMGGWVSQSLLGRPPNSFGKGRKNKTILGLQR